MTAPMPDDVPTWDLLHRLNDGSNLTPVGKAAVLTALKGLERRLGPSWLKRQFRTRVWLPPELSQFAARTAVLPQLLTLYLRVEAWADDPGFAPVLGKIRKTCGALDWRHAMLQLEVARAAQAAGWLAHFEPDIPGSVSKGDLLLEIGGKSPVLIETTTLSRTMDDRMNERFEDDLQDRLRFVEDQHGVHAITELTGRTEPEAARRWCEEIAQAAATVAASGSPITVESSIGTVTLHRGDVPVAEPTFRGVPRMRDLSLRLRAKVRDKAKQSAGPYPAWIRLDGLDGIFALTPWARSAPEGRVAALAEVLVEPLADHPHVHGVIYSSGMAGAGYGASSGTLDATVETTQGIFLRRELAQFLFREMVILPVRPEGHELASAWATAYGSEASWLDLDLGERDLPSLGEI